MKWLLLSLLLLSRSVVAMGQDKNLHDGNHLLHACQAGLTATAQAPPENPFDSGYCMGLLHGVSFIQITMDDICPGEGVTLEKLMRVVVKYLNDNPARLNEDATALVMVALHQAWSCPQKKSEVVLPNLQALARDSVRDSGIYYLPSH